MARRRRRGGHRGFRVGKWVNLAFKILGGAVAAGPAIRAVTNSVQGGKPQDIPESTLYQYTGYSISSRSLDVQQTGVGIASIVGGILIAKIGSFLGRRF